MTPHFQYFRISHGEFLDTRLRAVAPANTIHVAGTAYRDDYMRRLANSGCADGVAVELTPAEYRAVVLAQFPQLAR